MRKDIRKMQMCRKQTHAQSTHSLCSGHWQQDEGGMRMRRHSTATGHSILPGLKVAQVDGGGNGILGHVRRFRTPTTAPAPSPGSWLLAPSVCVCLCRGCCAFVCISAKVAKWRLEKSPPIAIIIIVVVVISRKSLELWQEQPPNKRRRMKFRGKPFK